MAPAASSAWPASCPSASLRQRRQVLVRSVVVSVSANRLVRGLCLRVVDLSSRDACSSPHNVPYPAYPRVKRPSFAFALRSGTTLWRRPHGYAEELLGFFQRF